MKPPINPQLPRKPAIRQQRLSQHSPHKHRARIIIPLPGNLHTQLNPIRLPNHLLALSQVRSAIIAPTTTSKPLDKIPL